MRHVLETHVFVLLPNVGIYVKINQNV